MSESQANPQQNGSTRVTPEEIPEEAQAAAAEVADDASTTAKKVAGHARHGAERIEATADAAAEGIGDEANQALAGDKSVEAAAKNAAAIAETAGEQVTDQVDRTARQVAGEARAAGRRAEAIVDQEAERAGEALVVGGDRAARAGHRTEDELQTLAARTGHRIHAVTESAAVPLDQLAATLNPIRVTGRALAVVTVIGLRVVGRITGEGGELAQQGARRVAGS